MSFRLRAVVFLLVFCFAFRAGAQERQETRQEGGPDLVAEGKRLMAEGKYREACYELERAMTLRRDLETRLELARCSEKIGRLATALSLFREVESLSGQVGQQERASAAKESADALEQRVPSVLLRAPWLPSFPGATVRFDGRVLVAEELERPIRVDLGRHEVVARGEAGESRVTALVEREGEVKEVVVPEPGKGEPVPSPFAHLVKAQQAARRSPQRILGYVGVGVGLALVAVGGILLLDGGIDYDSATIDCGTSCPRSQAEAANDARGRINLAGVFGLGGLAMIGGSAVLLLLDAPATPPAPKAARLRLVPSVGRSGAGLGLGATF